VRRRRPPLDRIGHHGADQGPQQPAISTRRQGQKQTLFTRRRARERQAIRHRAPDADAPFYRQRFGRPTQRSPSRLGQTFRRLCIRCRIPPPRLHRRSDDRARRHWRNIGAWSTQDMIDKMSGRHADLSPDRLNICDQTVRGLGQTRNCVTGAGGQHDRLCIQPPITDFEPPAAIGPDDRRHPSRDHSRAQRQPKRRQSLCRLDLKVLLGRDAGAIAPRVEAQRAQPRLHRPHIAASPLSGSTRQSDAGHPRELRPQITACSKQPRATNRHVIDGRFHCRSDHPRSDQGGIHLAGIDHQHRSAAPMQFERRAKPQHAGADDHDGRRRRHGPSDRPVTPLLQDGFRLFRGH